MKFKKYFLVPLIIIAIGFSVRIAHATWVYTIDSISYCVSSNGTCTGITVNAGPDQNLVQPNAGMGGITGTAASTAGSITSTSWSYVGCTPLNQSMQSACPKSGMVISGASGTSSPLVATMVNMDGAAVGTRFTYKFSATDSAGNSKSDTMDIVITPKPSPDLTATYNGPSSSSPGTVTLTGTVTNGGGADATNSFTSYFEVQGDSTLSWTSPGITLAAGASQNVSATRSFNPASSTTYQVRLCADGANTVDEGTNEGNNCSGWNALTVTVVPPPPAVPTATISANPNPITAGASTTITWTCSSSATSCTGTNFNTGGSNSGSATDSPTSNKTYTVTASNSSGTDAKSVTVTVNAAPPPPPPGGTRCSNGIDDDGDGKIDMADPGCSSPSDDNETDPKPVFIEF